MASGLLVDALIDELSYLLSDRGLEEVRVPNLVSAMPITELLRRLESFDHLRVACFDQQLEEVPRKFDVTSSVQIAIKWRNEAAAEGSARPRLVILGGLDYARASGLSSVYLVHTSAVNKYLHRRIQGRLSKLAAQRPVENLFRAVKQIPRLSGIQALADYADAVLTEANKSKLGSVAQRELWRLGLLPDPTDKPIDDKRLRANAQLVQDLRAMDATTVQRVVARASDLGVGYRALREFADKGEREHLKELTFEGVRDAVKVGRETPGKGQGSSSTEVEEADDFLQAVGDKGHVESAFLAQVSETDGGPPNSVAVNGTDYEWEAVAPDQWVPLIADEQATAAYPAASSATEVQDPDTDDPALGSGDVAWTEFQSLVDDIAALEGAADYQGCIPALEAIADRRSELAPYMASLPKEGVRLLAAAPSLLKAAKLLIQSWLELWEQLEFLRDKLDPGDRGYLTQIGHRVALSDIRLVRHGTEVSAILLPLHPAVLDPRVRAAELTRDHPELVTGIFDLITESLDPAIPSISITESGTTHNLAYTGTFRSLPEYRSAAAQHQPSDAGRAIREVAERFVSVHPYAELSLHVALLDPAPETAAFLLKTLAGGRAQRLALDVYVNRSSEHEVRAQLDKTADALVNAEVPKDAYTFVVSEFKSLEEIPRILDTPERAPHVLVLFDPVGAAASSASLVQHGVPSLGSLVAEWEFRVNPLENQPIIQPRTGSGSLSKLLGNQARVLGQEVPTSVRSPIVPPAVQHAIEQLDGETTWLALAQGGSGLISPGHIGPMEMVGTISAGTYQTHVYSAKPDFLLEPVMRYLLQYFYDRPDQKALQTFLFGTLRDGLPEGMMGFFKRAGSLSSASVLGRLGYAAALRFLTEEDADAIQLIISLDTEGARRWLGLRDESGRRADLVVIRFAADAVNVSAVEVKSRSSYAGSAELIKEAKQQVDEMERLLRQILLNEEIDALTPSRREILKRQVFLEALQQWDDMRLSDKKEYADRIKRLNKLFDVNFGEPQIQLNKRIFVVTPPDEAGATNDVVDDADVTYIGISWLKDKLRSVPGGHVELPAELLSSIPQFKGETLSGSAIETDAGPKAPPQPNGVESGSAETQPELPEQQASAEGAGAAPAGEMEAQNLVRAFHTALVARKAPFVGIEEDEVLIGPSVVQLPFRVRAGSKLSALQAQESDLARDLGVPAVRILNYPGRAGYALAELPRHERDIPHVKSLAAPVDPPYLTVALGARMDGSPLWVALDDLPHLLVGGTTGSGKSVFVRSLLYQLTTFYGDDEFDLVIIDGKGMADYIGFAGVPQVRTPSDYVRDPSEALDLLDDIVNERLETRRAVFNEAVEELVRRPDAVPVTKLRDLLAQPEFRTSIRPLVLVIDEFAEIAMSSADRRRFETLVARFNQKARALGGHMVASTQRPSADVVTGVAKANFARVALRVQSAIDSRVILDEGGAENLLGRGDLLFKSLEAGVLRLQGYNAD